MLDIKHIDDEQHKILTGCTNRNILDFAKYLDEIEKTCINRHVLVPQRSDDDGALGKLREFIDGLSDVEKVEVLRIIHSEHINGRTGISSIRVFESV